MYEFHDFYDHPKGITLFFKGGNETLDHAISLLILMIWMDVSIAI